MPSDYDKIREDNILEYGQGTRHLSFLGRLYTDRTHFVFELLQNAEDAGATRILFNLFEDRLEVAHDGRLFDEQDVRGVCGVGEGTKAEDLTQIGKFGIGFKSVYAYTASPEVHSGGEGFRIENYVRPYAVPLKSVGNSWTTLFVFPFDTEEISPETACKEISARLRNLSARTLLFLRRINEIEYRLPNSTGGVYLREETARGPARQVSVIGQNKGKDEEESWLIFERPVAVPGKSLAVRVEVSFRLEATEDKAGKNPEHIIKVKDSPLVVYFPTEKDTRFGFLIQGPYRTTPSRDNIPKDDEWNETLVRETAELVGDVLSKIKDLGLLSVSFLEALPVRSEDFPEDSMFYPIIESVRNALLGEELLPADDGSFVSAKNAKLARGADLRKLLNQTQLCQLFQSPAIIKWLAGEITQDRTPDLRSYLISELEVEEVTPDSLARRISLSFISDQPDEWFVDFYGYLSGQEALWRAPRMFNSGGVLRSKPILRLDNGTHDAPFKPDSTTPNVFLPPPEKTTFPVVKRSIVSDEQALTFLTRLGLSEPDVFDDIVERVLPKYNNTEHVVLDAEHQADIHKIIRAMGSDSEVGKRKVIQAARQTPFLKATNLSGVTLFKKPTAIYLNTPELRQYFSSAHEVWFLGDEYAMSDVDIDVWHDLGVSGLPRKLSTSEGLPKDQREYTTRAETVENYDLDGLGQFLQSIQVTTDFEEQKKSATVLWDFLRDYLEQDGRFFKARYQWFYYSTQSKYFSSMILVRLKNAQWIPTKDGSLEKPSEISTDQLPDEFLCATELIENLGINNTADQDAKAIKLLREDFGIDLFSPELLKVLREMSTEDLHALTEEYRSRKAAQAQFPEHESKNPERREQKTKEGYADAPDKESEQRERTVRTSQPYQDPKTYLKGKYSNNGQLFCQMCQHVMPFKQRDKSYYFESVQLFDDFKKEVHQLYLALCPNCAAKYKTLIKKHEVSIQSFKSALVSCTDTYVFKLEMYDSELPALSLRFVQDHLQDIRTNLLCDGDVETDGEDGVEVEL